jgi:hypothetical protein
VRENRTAEQDMAEADYREFVAGDGASPVSGYGRMVQIVGALTSLALVVAVAVWGYKLAVRDANGVPVIQAMQGPMRVAPEDPGGRVAAHLGLSVNRVAGEGSAAAVPDRIVLAPPPIEVTDEDTPGIGTAAPVPTPVTLPDRSAEEAEAAARSLALAESLTSAAPVNPDGAASPVSPDDVAEAVAAAIADTALPPGVPHRSLRPRPRPESLVRAPDQADTAVLSNTTNVAASAVPDEIAPDAVAPGARLVQIGAFDDVEAARREWARVASLHPALFEGKARVIQPATSAGQAFYRLRVHDFANEQEARQFCSAVEAGNLRCIPVPVR